MAQCAPLIAPYAAAPGKGSRTQCPAPWNLRATAPRVAPCRWAHQDERRPALEPDAAHEREAARAIAGERSIGLCGEQARQHDLTAQRDKPRNRRREPLQRCEQNVGEDQPVRAARAEGRGAEACGMDDLNLAGDAVDARVVARDR